MVASQPHWRRYALIAGSLLGAFALLYAVLPAIAGLDETWRRLSSGEPVWLIAAGLFEVASFAGYLVYFRLVFSGSPVAPNWRASYRITMAGVVATRLLSTAGAGGIALTTWALRRFGWAYRELAGRLASFYVILYGIFFAGLLGSGLALASGALPGEVAPALALTAAGGAALVISVVLAPSLLPGDLESFGRDREQGRLRWLIAAAPATLASGVRGAIALLSPPRAGLLGAVAWWAFDIAVLWACLEAFGRAPAIAALVFAYFLGQTANTLPIPGGIGAVEGGMIGALIATGVEPGLAIVAVLSYRAFAFWLPTVPGLFAYLELVRSEPVAPEAG